MAYTDFSLNDLKIKFNVNNKIVSLFKETVLKIQPSQLLTQQLAEAEELPVRSEKARSELVVMPVLADKSKGLTGECDFILAKDTQSFSINLPIITIVEAKKQDIESGINQCAAQLYGAKIFNEEGGVKLDKIYGCVTTADNWKFMLIENDIIKIDKDIYYKSEVDEILGIFQTIMDYYKQILA